MVDKIFDWTKCMNSWMNEWIYQWDGYINGMVKWLIEWKDRCMYGLTDGQIYGLVVGYTVYVNKKSPYSTVITR